MQPPSESALKIFATRSGRLTTAVVLAITWLAAPEANAQEPTRVLVIPFTGDIPDHPEINDAFTKAASRVAAVGGAEVIAASASLADAAALAGCSPDAEACLDIIVEQLGVSEIMFGAITPAGNDNLEVNLTYHRAGKTRVREFEVPAAPLAEQSRVVAREAAALLSGAEPEEPPPPEPAAPEPPPAAPTANLVTTTPRAERPRAGLLGSVRTRTWIALGASVVLSGTGGVFYLLADRRQSDVDSHRAETPQDFRDLVALEDEVQRDATIGNVLMIAGGAALVTGAALLILDARAGRSGTTVALVPQRGGAGIALSMELP